LLFSKAAENDSKN